MEYVENKKSPLPIWTILLIFIPSKMKFYVLPLFDSSFRLLTVVIIINHFYVTTKNHFVPGTLYFKWLTTKKTIAIR